MEITIQPGKVRVVKDSDAGNIVTCPPKTSSFINTLFWEQVSKKTGYKMSDYIVENGAYEKAFVELQNLGGKISLTEIKKEKNCLLKKIKYL